MVLVHRIRQRIIDMYRRYGWKAVVGIFLYYLIRDSILYILIPWLAIRSLT